MLEAVSEQMRIIAMPIAERARVEGDQLTFPAYYLYGEVIEVALSRSALTGTPYLRTFEADAPAFDRPVALNGRWSKKKEKQDFSNRFEAVNRFEASSIAPHGEAIQIVFASKRDGNEEIYLMDLNGGNQRNLTHHGAEDGTPSLSPDQKQVVFASNRRNGNWDVYSMPVSGSKQPINLTMSDADDGWPTWSPKGDKILFISDRMDKKRKMFLMDEDGQMVRPLHPSTVGYHGPADATGRGVEIGHAAWSFDGTEIAFSFVNGSETGLRHYLPEADWSRFGHGKEDSTCILDYPSLSPGDRFLAHTGYDPLESGDKQALMVDNRVVLRGDFDVRYPAWAPDGRLVFTVAKKHSRHGSEDREIYITKVAVDEKTVLDLHDANSILRLTRNAADDNHPAIIFPPLDNALGKTLIAEQESAPSPPNDQAAQCKTLKNRDSPLFPRERDDENDFKNRHLRRRPRPCRSAAGS